MRTITCFGDPDKWHFPYNCLGLSDEKKTYQKEKKISDTAWLGKKRTKK